jgi:hypothetical protein
VTMGFCVGEKVDGGIEGGLRENAGQDERRLKGDAGKVEERLQKNFHEIEKL